MEFDDEERDDEEMEVMPVAPPGYGSVSAASRPRMGPTGEGAVSTTARKRGPITNNNNNNPTANTVRYRECQKNHAVNIGSHAVDGCCEFLASGEEGTMGALKCAACNCHRNFHRKEPAEGGGGGEMIVHHHHHGHGSGGRGGGPHHLHQLPSAYYRGPPPPPSGYLITSPQQARAAALASGGGGRARSSREEGDQELVSNPSSSGGSEMQRKRYRTKFTAEQKQKMLEFAEKVGWRMQKHDEAAVEEFCEEMGVKRHVFKVWMHNNKHTLGKKLGP